MNIEEKVKMNLIVRGFDSNTQLNNRGLIGATIDETILEVVKNLNIDNVSNRRELLIKFANMIQSNTAHLDLTPEKWVQLFLDE